MAEKFHIGEALTITTGKMLSVRGMGGVYEILNYMTGDNLFTHQLPRAMNECKPWIIRQNPRLTEFDAEGITPENAKDYIHRAEEQFGEFIEVCPIPADDHERKDPVAELIEMRGGTDGIVVVKPE